MEQELQIEVGCAVEQIMPAPRRGRVIEFGGDRTKPRVQALVGWTEKDPEGVEHEARAWFDINDLKVTEAAPPQVEVAETAQASDTASSSTTGG